MQALLESVGQWLGLALDNSRLEAENLQTTVAREHQRMATGVHDPLAQSLVFLKMHLPLLEDALRAYEESRAPVSRRRPRSPTGWCRRRRCRVLEPLFDEDLAQEQYAYRRDRGAHAAVPAVQRLLNAGQTQ